MTGDSLDFDVIVVGLGAMGSASCWQLAKSGARVLGIEQFQIGHGLGSSHGETRIFRKAYFEHPQYVPLLQRAEKLWREVETTNDVELYHETGVVYLGAEDSVLQKGVRDSARIHNLDVRSLQGAERKKIGKWFWEENFQSALLEKEAGFVRVDPTLKTLIKNAKSLGAEIHPEERVVKWNSDARGVQVKTNKAVYSAKKLVLSTGPWIAGTLRELGVPMRILRKSLAWVQAPRHFEVSKGMPCYLVELPEGIFYGFPSVSDGLIKLSEHSGGSPVEDPAKVDRSLEPKDRHLMQVFARGAFIGVGENIVRYEVCMYTTTPDEHFILDFHPEHNNVVMASCCSGHGFKFTPVIGELVKDMVMTEHKDPAIDFLGVDRFKSS